MLRWWVLCWRTSCKKYYNNEQKNKTNIGQHSWKVLPNFANIASEHKQQQSSNISGAAAWLASLYLTIVQLQSPLSQPSFLVSLPLAFSFAKHHATYAKSGTEEKRKWMNVSTKRVTHTLLLATIHTHTQPGTNTVSNDRNRLISALYAAQLLRMSNNKTTTTTPATQAGRVSRAWLGPLHTAGRGGYGGVTTQVSPGVFSFAFGAFIARQLPVPVLIPTPSILPLTLPPSRQDNEIFAVLLCNWSLEMACYDADAAVGGSASATGKHWHILLWHNKVFSYTEKRSITSSLPPSPAQEGVPPISLPRNLACSSLARGQNSNQMRHLCYKKQRLILHHVL